MANQAYEGQDRLAERAYSRLIDHAKDCAMCEPEGDGGDRSRMCAVGRELLDLWERAEERVVLAERRVAKSS